MYYVATFLSKCTIDIHREGRKNSAFKFDQLCRYEPFQDIYVNVYLLTTRIADNVILDLKQRVPDENKF
jgi:hypothetical protein